MSQCVVECVLPDPAERSLQHRHRSRRVTILLIGIVLLSIIDLVITLVYLNETGFLEANPIAAFIIRHSPDGTNLILFKLATITITSCLLFSLRTRRASEIACWACLVILGWLSVQWHQYSHEFDQSDTVQLVQAVQQDPNWLTLDGYLP